MADWKGGLFGCFDNFSVCIITYFLPCYTTGKNAETVGEDCLKCGLAQLIPYANIYFAAKIRGQIREAKGIEGSFGNDCLMHCCCHCCATIQEANEMDAMGANVSMARE